MVEAACIEVAKTDTLPQAEVLVRRVARRVYHLIRPLTETSFPGQEAIDEADALLMDLDRTDGAWMGEGARPPMEEFLARIAERLTQASLTLGAAETDGNDPVAAARCLVREALPLAIALPVAFRTWRLAGDSSALIALQDGRQPARAPEPAAMPETAKAKEHCVLDAIALQASILLDVVDSAGRTCDLAEIHEALDAARVLTATIGSLADGMTGETKRGNQYDWHNATPN